MTDDHGCHWSSSPFIHTDRIGQQKLYARSLNRVAAKCVS